MGSGSTFYFDYQDGKFGFNTSANRGADTFNPFSSGGGNIIYIGQYTGNQTINVSSKLSDYQSLTDKDFAVQFISAPATSSGSNSYDDRGFYGYASGFTVNKSYDASTGNLTISGVSQTIALRTNMYTATQFMTYAVYALSSTEIKNFPLDTQWGINGNIGFTSADPSRITLSGFVVGKKYLSLVMAAYTSGTFLGATWTGATENWNTWIWNIPGYGSNYYPRLQLVCITATAATITAVINTNYGNWVVIASEDGPL